MELDLEEEAEINASSVELHLNQSQPSSIILTRTIQEMMDYSFATMQTIMNVNTTLKSDLTLSNM